MKAEEKLKPCPFCGGSATFRLIQGYLNDAAWVKCDLCNATIEASFEGWNDEKIRKTLEHAWNTRTETAKKGEWIYDKSEMRFWCSECREWALQKVNLETEETDDLLTDFCPYCGADMR